MLYATHDIEHNSLLHLFPARSPIFSHVNATFQGLTTIHSSDAEKRLTDEFHYHMDLNSSTTYLYLATTRAFAYWLEIVCVIYIATITLSFIVFNQKHGESQSCG